MEQQSKPGEVRQLTRNFLLRTGMAPADFARRIGYHYSTLNQFLLDKYHRGPGSREAAICEAVLRFLGAQSEMEPETFAGTLYNIGNMRAMRKALRQLCERPCILLCYAPPGSGKTEVARALIPGLRTPEVEIRRIYCRAAITRRDLMRRIAVACGSIADRHRAHHRQLAL